MNFELKHEDPFSKARAGTLVTDHGIIETPMFMPVGTAGTVKGIFQKDLSGGAKAQIILGNTYHLYLRPGLEVLHKVGGLHRFIAWDKPILTDSGGYQVYSLSGVRKIQENGVVFNSHIDGSKHLFTPESVMDIQRTIGADIVMAFDECTPYPCEFTYALNSMELTHRWLIRCKEHWDNNYPLYDYNQSLFPIVQGSVYPELRKKSAEFIASIPFDGYAIGGLSVGEPAEDMYAMSSLVCEILPKDKPRYLMGVGTPVNIIENIALGIDLFDCVMPTRNGRNGMLFTKNGIINIKNEKWKMDYGPLEEESELEVDQQYSKAYLRHLIHSGEMLGAQIASLHNIHFYIWLTREARKQILNDTFTQWKNYWIPRLSQRL